MRPLRKNNYPAVLFLPLLLALSACEVFNPEEEIPSYIRIERMNVSTDLATQGSTSHKITDAWLYVDDQFIGAFELPANIPVLAGGEHTVKIRAGIKQNGISATRVQYPFYNFYTSSANLQRGSVTNMQPVVTYFSGTTFAWLENFDNTGTTMSSGPLPTDTIVVQQSNVVFEGTQSGAIVLDGNKSVFFGTSATAYNLPAGEQNSWLELNYKCNNPFTVGIMTTSNLTFPVLVVNPSDDWNKIYIDLSPEVSSHNGPFHIYISMARAETVSSAQLYIDNIKLVH
jgi:hypothetical protein